MTKEKKEKVQKLANNLEVAEKKARIKDNQTQEKLDNITINL